MGRRVSGWELGNRKPAMSAADDGLAGPAKYPPFFDFVYETGQAEDTLWRRRPLRRVHEILGSARCRPIDQLIPPSRTTPETFFPTCRSNTERHGTSVKSRDLSISA